MLEINNLKKSFNMGTSNEIHIFNNFSLNIKAGKCTAIIGPNGCGKSTLLNIIAGNLEVEEGLIILNSNDISSLKEEERAKYIARVYQDPSMGVSPSLSILENLSLADKKGKKFNLNKLVDKEEIPRFKEILKPLKLGLEDKLDSKVKYLSGGQRQALSLVMATMKNPKLLLLDEHTAALDPKTSRLIMHKTRELIQSKNITTLMISHNMKDALEFSDYILMLNQGKLVFYEESKNIKEEDLLSIYNLT